MGQKIYLDTNLYIAFFEGESGISLKVEDLLINSKDNELRIISSPLTITELLIIPLKDENLHLIEVYKSLKSHINNIDFIDFSPNISIIAANLRSKYNLNIPDCIHLATAIEEKVDIFYTADKGIRKVKEVKIVLV